MKRSGRVLDRENAAGILHMMRPPGSACTDIFELVNDNFPGRDRLTVLEIGSYAGESARLFLETGKVGKIVCIDPWVQYKDISIPVTNFRSAAEAENAEKAFDRIFSGDGRVVKVKDYSENVSFLFADHAFDLVYIDGNHQAENVRKDLENYLVKVKPGGIMSGHDYEPKPGLAGLIREVDAFFGRKPDRVLADFSWFYRIPE